MKVHLIAQSLNIELQNDNILDSHCVLAVEIGRTGKLVLHYNVPFPPWYFKLPNTKQFTCSAQLGCAVRVKCVKIFISKNTNKLQNSISVTSTFYCFWMI